jgi:acyl carrier protein
MSANGATESKIREFLAANFGFRGATPDLDAKMDLLAQGILDSTAVLEVIAFMEEELAIKVQDNEIVPENLSSIERMLAFISRKEAATT